ncbi:zinc ribbon domain-containing protein [Crystallibacter crystallopoietes]|uniref:zinc ribbon domain-containing protein n=1 Tax=Crystallibacter crystallopoietes TaxID=37928 RepID=UPI00167F6872|nr:zinc ribbon domain-containing protein [Arthrobacter crystallopoietes]
MPNQAKIDQLKGMAVAVQSLRSDVWSILRQRDMAAVSMYDFRTVMTERGLTPGHYGLQQRIWRQNVETAFREVRLWQEAAKQQYGLKRKIFRRAAGNKAEERRLFTVLKVGDWLSDPWLHKHTRKAFRAKPKPSRQKLRLSFDSASYNTKRDSEGRLWLSLMGAANRQRIKLCFGRVPEKLTPCGEIQVFFHAENDIQIHTGFDEFHACAGDAIPEPGRKVSTHTRRAERESLSAKAPAAPVDRATTNKPYRILGIDAGRTEAFIDSHGTVYGHGLGQLCEEHDAKTKGKRASRSKLREQAKALRKQAEVARRAGNPEKARRLTRKADNIYAHNLSTGRQTAARSRHRARVRDLIFRAVHEIAAVTNCIAAEKFSQNFSYDRSRKQNRLNSGWMRSIVAEALDAAARRRGSSVIHVNPAYTSQQVRRCGHLGKRTNGSVYCTEGSCPEFRVKYHDDMDAAGSIEDRAADPHITLSMTPKQVREVILSRY